MGLFDKKKKKSAVDPRLAKIESHKREAERCEVEAARLEKIPGLFPAVSGYEAQASRERAAANRLEVQIAKEEGRFVEGEILPKPLKQKP